MLRFHSIAMLHVLRQSSSQVNGVGNENNVRGKHFQGVRLGIEDANQPNIKTGVKVATAKDCGAVRSNDPQVTATSAT